MLFSFFAAELRNGLSEDLKQVVSSSSLITHSFSSLFPRMEALYLFAERWYQYY